MGGGPDRLALGGAAGIDPAPRNGSRDEHAVEGTAAGIDPPLGIGPRDDGRTTAGLRQDGAISDSGGGSTGFDPEAFVAGIDPCDGGDQPSGEKPNGLAGGVIFRSKQSWWLGFGRRLQHEKQRRTL